VLVGILIPSFVAPLARFQVSNQDIDRLGCSHNEMYISNLHSILSNDCIVFIYIKAYCPRSPLLFISASSTFLPFPRCCHRGFFLLLSPPFVVFILLRIRVGNSPPIFEGTKSLRAPFFTIGQGLYFNQEMA